MDFEDDLNELSALAESARGVPMTSSIMVDKEELTRLVNQLRYRLPEDLIVAQSVLTKRQELLAEANADARQLVEAGSAEQRRLVSQHEVMRVARAEADAVTTAAQDEAERLAEEAADYVDGKLAELEDVIGTMLQIVRHGRDKLARSRSRAEVTADDGPLV